MPVIGLLTAGFPETSVNRVSAFRQGLNETGYVEGQNVAAEYRWAEGRYDRFPELVADLIRRNAKVIATPGSPDATRAAKAATSTLPIVFAVGEDPVKLGLVTTLARPGTNMTGVNFFASELSAKRLGLLRELVPRAARVAVLINPTNPASAETTVKDVQAAAPALGFEVQIFNASTIARLTQLIQTSCVSAPKRYSSPATGFSTADACNLPCWLYVMRFPRPMRCVNMWRPAG